MLRGGGTTPSPFPFPPSTQKLAAPPPTLTLLASSGVGGTWTPRQVPHGRWGVQIPPALRFGAASPALCPGQRSLLGAGSGPGEHLGAPAQRRQAGTPKHPKSVAGECSGPIPVPGGVLHAESFVSGGNTRGGQSCRPIPCSSWAAPTCWEMRCTPTEQTGGTEPPIPRLVALGQGCVPVPTCLGTPGSSGWCLYPRGLQSPAWSPPLYPPLSDTPSSAVCWGGCSSPCAAVAWPVLSGGLANFGALDSGFTIVLNLLLKASAVVGRGGVPTVPWAPQTVGGAQL